MNFKQILLSLALLVVASPSIAVNYYIKDCGTGAHGSCTPGSNANNGTSPATPWQSTTAAVIRGANPGDVFSFAIGGAWNSSPFVSLYKNGADGSNVDANITINAYDPGGGVSGRPRFNVASGACIQIDGQFGDLAWDGPWTIEGIDCRGTGATSGPAVIASKFTRRVTLQNLHIENWEACVFTYESHYSFTMKNNTCLNIYGQGFLGGGLRGALFEGNLFENNGINAPTAGPTEHAMYVGCQTFATDGCSDIVIRRNTFRSNGQQTGNGNRCGGGNMTVHGAIEGALIENNLIDNSQFGFQGGCLGISLTAGYGFPEYMRNFVVRGNRIVDSGSGVTVRAVPSVIIENNIATISQAAYTGVVFGYFPASGDGDDLDTAGKWRNNLVYIANATGGAVAFNTAIASSTNMVVSSNIIYYGSVTGTNYCFEHNSLGSYTSFGNNWCYSASGTVNFSPTYSTNGAAQTAGFNTGGGTTNPNFVALPATGNNFSACAVNSGSPLINAGNATYAARLSYKGRSPSGLRDVGPCEFGVD